MDEDTREIARRRIGAFDALMQEARAHQTLVHAALRSPPCEAEALTERRIGSSDATPSMYLQTLGYGLRAAWIYQRAAESLIVHGNTKSSAWHRLVRLQESYAAAEPPITRQFAQHACAIVMQFAHETPPDARE